MKISGQSSVEAEQQRQNQRDLRKSSDRFSSLLDSHVKQQRDGDKVTRLEMKEQREKLRESSGTVMSAVGRRGQGGEAPEPVYTAVEEVQAPSQATPAHLHKLAEELGQQIELHGAGNAQGLDITFHSKSLHGLRVEIRRTQGALSIRFLAPSSGISDMLSRNSPALRSTLEEKGLAVERIVISGRQTAGISREGEYA